MGIVNILKTLSQSSGPYATGLLAGHGHFWVAFVAAGSLKATYDLLLLAFFAGRVHQPADPGVEGEASPTGVGQNGDPGRGAPETNSVVPEDESEADALDAAKIPSVPEDGGLVASPLAAEGSSHAATRS